MKEPLFIDTKLTVKASKWSDLKQYGESIGGILYLPIGICVNRLPIWKTKSEQQNELETNQQEIVDIKKLENNEKYSTDTTDSDES
jgi:hypothetical protein